MNISLTELAQQYIAQILQPGQGAIDATAGNGHDTVFLARQVGCWGKVFAFDIQTSALDRARDRLRQQGLDKRVTWFCCSHEAMQEKMTDPWQQAIRAVMFNLGYLPGGDKQVITRPQSTLAALSQALKLLARKGRITMIAYTGHPGGQAETGALTAWLEEQATHSLSWRVIIPAERCSPPQLFVIDKQ